MGSYSAVQRVRGWMGQPLYCSVNSSPRCGIAPQSLNSSFQLLRLPEDQRFCPGYVWLWQACLILILFRLPQISCFTLSLKCFSSNSGNGPRVGMGPLLQFPRRPRAGPVLLKLLFFSLVSSTYLVLCGSIYYFLLVRYSYLLLAAVLHALLCLKVYSWVYMERYVLHIQLLLCHLVLQNLYVDFLLQGGWVPYPPHCPMVSWPYSIPTMVQNFYFFPKIKF